MSGRPIYPIAVVTSRRFDFRSWDRASLGKPFGRGAMVLGQPVRVARDADAATLEAARHSVEAELDRVHRRAYGLIGARDPGARASGDGMTAGDAMVGGETDLETRDASARNAP